MILFDIDGTLVQMGKLHTIAFENALKTVFGVNTPIKWPYFHGRTDLWILKEFPKANGVPENIITERFNLFSNTVARIFEQGYTTEEGFVEPGVRELLNMVDQQEILRGLVTGNVERIAYLKLHMFNLESGFGFGGFGNEHIDRSELIRIAIQKARQRFQFKGTKKDVLYIADTPLDISAAHEVGIKAVAVQTNQSEHFDFSKEQPELILPNLLSSQKIFELLY